LCLAAVIATVSARPRFLAVPLEDIQFINGLPQIIPHAQHRIVRRSPRNYLNSLFFNCRAPIFLIIPIMFLL
jgi:hypothetical protein